MATWEDGPEYAPVERPVDFGRPSVAELDVAPPDAQQAAWAPKDRPVFSAPPVPVAPLATLVPATKDPRDPQLPFDVASATITGDGAWGALHWSPPSGLPPAGPAGVPPAPGPMGSLPAAGPYAPPVLNGPPAPYGQPTLNSPPAPGPWAPGQQPMNLSPGPPPVGPGGYPVPGTPEWFAPGHYDPPPNAPVTASRVLQAATPGLCICLVLGGLMYVLAPILLAVGFALSSRITAAQQVVRRVFIVAVSLLGLLALGGALANETGFADWWRFVGIWALVICWAVLGTVLWLVHRDLKTPDISPRRATWG